MTAAINHPDLAARRREWAARLIGRCTEPAPSYGSAAWLALPEGSAAAVAAVVVAAECWAVDGDDLEGRLRRELEDRWYAEIRADDDDYLARVVGHRDQWGHLAQARPPRYAGQVVRPLEKIGAAYMAGRGEATP